MRPEIATSPRIIRNSSIWVTLRSLVHPDDGHGTALVSGISRERRGPDSPSRSRMSRRNRSFASSHARDRSCLGPGRHVGEVEAEVAHRPDDAVELEQGPIDLERLLQVGRPVVGPEPAPRDEVRARRDGGGRIELQQRQPLDDLEQVGGSRRIEQLGTDRDPPRLRELESMGGHVPEHTQRRGSVSGMRAA